MKDSNTVEQPEKKLPRYVVRKQLNMLVKENIKKMKKYKENANGIHR